MLELQSERKPVDDGIKIVNIKSKQDIDDAMNKSIENLMEKVDLINDINDTVNDTINDESKQGFKSNLQSNTTDIQSKPNLQKSKKKGLSQEELEKHKKDRNGEEP